LTERLDRRRLLARAASAAALLALGEVPRAHAAGADGFRSRRDLTPLPVVVETAAMATAPGYLFVAPFVQGGSGTLAILDSSGAPVWLRPLKRKIAADFRVQQFRGTPVLTWWEGAVSAEGIGDGEYVVVDSSYRELARVQAGNRYAGDLHEFLLTDRGTALVTIYSDVDGVVDSIVQEIDVGRRRVVFEWHSLEHVAVDDSYLSAPASAPFDYFHVNSIDVDRDGHLLISARNTWTVYKLDRASGAIRWRLGGKRSDFSIGEGATFAWQHDVRRQPDGTLTLFDNANFLTGDSTSRGLRLRLVRPTRAAELVDSYTRQMPVSAVAMGSLQALPNGNTLVGWGIQPFVTELGPSGQVELDLRLPAGMMSYRAYRFPWNARPAAEPAIAVARSGAGARVFASWNGSTGTAFWRVAGGDRPDDLRPLRTVARHGFETAILLPARPSLVQVAALDGRKRVLARSRVVRSEPTRVDRG
jgi:hypothetical protein